MGSDRKDLIERLEAAEGPDRELDALLWAEFDGRDTRYLDNKMLAKSRRPPHDECLLGFVDPGAYSRNFTPAGGHKPPIPRLTASLDAAIALVEKVLPGWSLILSTSEGLKYPAVRMGRSYPTNLEVAVEHHTAPLAIVLAVLHALRALESRHGCRKHVERLREAEASLYETDDLSRDKLAALFRLAVHALASARRDALEAAIRIARDQPYYPDTNIGMRQQWVKDQIVAKLERALADMGGDDA